MGEVIINKNPYNKYSKKEDADLKIAMNMMMNYAFDNLPLPDGYTYEIWKTLSYSRMKDWFLRLGHSEEQISHLEILNPSGKGASIEPDGGIIVMVKKDSGSNILDWVPILSAESKHQESDVGNAVERFFKNYNALKELFEQLDIFPYLCFAQGNGFLSDFILNKLRVGMGNDINLPVNIHKENQKYNTRKSSGILKNIKKESYERHSVGLFYCNGDTPWDIDAMCEKLCVALRQSYNFYMNKNTEKY